MPEVITVIDSCGNFFWRSTNGWTLDESYFSDDAKTRFMVNMFLWKDYLIDAGENDKPQDDKQKFNVGSQTVEIDSCRYTS